LGNYQGVIYPAEGVMTIRYLSTLHAGYYQCRAFNMYGTSISNITVLQKAEIGSYPSTRTLEVTGEEGKPFTINCQPVKCFPKPSFDWALAERDNLDAAPTRLLTDNRMQIDEQGMSALFSE